MGEKGPSFMLFGGLFAPIASTLQSMLSAWGNQRLGECCSAWRVPGEEGGSRTFCAPEGIAAPKCLTARTEAQELCGP